MNFSAVAGDPGDDPEQDDPERDRVDKRDPEPLTDQLERILRRRIETGAIAGRMPSELALMAEHDVARVTVRRALARLEEAGLVYPAAGRGWFVGRPPS